MNKKIHVLLADDDADDRFFFEYVFRELSISTHLSTVSDGEKLMEFLHKNSNDLPDVLFLDLNMPRKNGSECLSEIKSDEKLRQLPVIIYSTSFYEEVARQLYENGAHYYVRKSDLVALKKVLYYVLTRLVDTKFTRPSWDKFVLDMVEV